MTSNADWHEKCRALREGGREAEELSRLLLELGESDCTSAEPDVAVLLQHVDPLVRLNAIWVLAFKWDLPHYRDQLEAMLARDPDVDVRHTAASALGRLLRGSRDGKLTELLLRKLRSEEEDPLVREVAYGALLDVWLQRTLTVNDLRQEFARLSDYARRTKALSEELGRAESAGDTARADAIREELRRPDETWKERVDWDAVAAIERGEAPTPQKSTGG